MIGSWLDYDCMYKTEHDRFQSVRCPSCGHLPCPCTIWTSRTLILFVTDTTQTLFRKKINPELKKNMAVPYYWASEIVPTWCIDIHSIFWEFKQFRQNFNLRKFPNIKSAFKNFNFFFNNTVSITPLHEIKSQSCQLSKF